MILLLPPKETLGDTAWELSTPSDEFLGLSEIGDLMDSLRGCLLSEALIDRGMHFDPPVVASPLSSVESNCLQLLQISLNSTVSMNSKKSSRGSTSTEYPLPVLF